MLANQTECVDCSRGVLVVEEVGQTLSEYSDSTASSSLLWSGDETSGSSSNEQTRRSFQEEFSSLIIKSDNFKSFITSAPETHFGEQINIPVTSLKSNSNRFSNKFVLIIYVCRFVIGLFLSLSLSLCLSLTN